MINLRAVTDALEELRQTVVAGCKRIASIRIISKDERRIAAASAEYWQEATEDELDKLLAHVLSPIHQGEIMPQLNESQKQQLTALGIDLSKIDWTKVISIFQLILSLFSQPQPTHARAAKAGCESQHAAMMAAAAKSLEVTQACLECAESCCVES